MNQVHRSKPKWPVINNNRDEWFMSAKYCINDLLNNEHQLKNDTLAYLLRLLRPKYCHEGLMK
uniref:Uncharacterized protein n=1 Tax=Romanomermis culicivorax TaxID=13658 RepID=A0A915I4M0_ROMCU